MNVVERLSQLIDTNPTEFDIAILRSSTTSTSTEDPFVLTDGHLGLNAGDLAWLARDFRAVYRTVRADHNRKDASSHLLFPQQEESLLKATSCLLLVCPDHATAWADRKRVLISTTTTATDCWQNELQFLNLLMTKHTKAPTSWFHRKYVFQRLLLKDGSAMTTTDTPFWIRLAKDEIKICTAVADRYPKNYYAWTHRIYVLRTLYNLLFDNNKDDGSSNDDSPTSSTPATTEAKTKERDQFLHLLHDEWQSTKTWLRSHVSDHSAAHFGGRVLNMLGKMYLQHKDTQHDDGDNSDTETIGAGLSVMTEAVDAAKCLVEKYPTHEVLWIFRRLCSHEFLSYIFDAPQQQCRERSVLAMLTTALSTFWSQEITGLVVQDDNARTETHNDNEMFLEAQQTRIYRLSYVAWVLEYLARRAGDVEFQSLDLRTEQISNLRDTAVDRLRQIEEIPFSVYRECKTVVTNNNY